MRSMISTFVPGFEPLVEAVLAQQIPGAVVTRVMSGLVQYRLGGKGHLPEIPFFNNTFACLATFPKAKGSPVEMMVQRVCQFGGNDEAVKLLPPHAATFRLVCMVQGELVPVPARLMQAAEDAITTAFGLVSNRARPDVEFWINYRKEGMGFFMLRVTRHSDFQKSLKKGELRPDLASMLCLMSDPHREDRVLDPFCGRGAILRARTQWPRKSLRGGDLDGDVLRDAARVEGALAERMDALAMESIPDHSVDAVITDPPWGAYTKLEDMYAFYSRFLRELRRVLTANGRAVLLVPREKDVERALKEGWQQAAAYPVLVSGKKAQAVLVYPR